MLCAMTMSFEEGQGSGTSCSGRKLGEHGQQSEESIAQTNVSSFPGANYQLAAHLVHNLGHATSHMWESGPSLEINET